MLYFLKDLQDVFGPFRLFEYQSVRAVIAAFIALLVGFAVARPLLRKLQNIRQPERDASLMGELAKTGSKVPTMGGLLIFFCTLAGTLLAARPNVYVYGVLAVYVGMSLVGFWDDYKKVKLQSSDGISEKQKWIGLTASALTGFGILIAHPGARENICELWIPFTSTPLLAGTEPAYLLSSGLPEIALLIGAAAFFWLVCVGASNAVNLTDGVDGLATGCLLPNIAVFGAIAYFAGNSILSEYLNINYIPGVGELTIFCSALAAGALVFLWFNGEPAEVYMGDIGALGIGGALGAVAVVSGQPFLLPISGFIFVAEALSVIIQRSYFKATKRLNGEGKRIFLMTPIHHHYQKKGLQNSKIVLRMWMISLVLAVVALMTLKIR